MSNHLAIDFGTTNTVVAVARAGSGVRVLHLPDIARAEAQPDEPQSALIPTAVHLSQVTRPYLFLFRRYDPQVVIGRRALDQNYDGRSPAFAQSFKPLLGLSLIHI